MKPALFFAQMPKNFPPPNPQKTADEIEREVLQFWEKNQIFEKSVESRPRHQKFVFFDGPPFATGLPHYGHFLASIIKDVVPRYFTMRGFRVPRVWGWDCHGLPIENLVEKELGTASKKDISEKIGLANFNEKCREKVLHFADEWEKIIRRLGRWVDFENGYKTMDASFMQSVISAFAHLHQKGLIYEGRRVSLYCPRCETPLSNFEIAMDHSYQIRHDRSVFVKFKLQNGEIALAWTTTPWTLPSNFALAVHPEIMYAKVQKDGEVFVLAENLVEKVFGANTQTFRVEFETEGSIEISDSQQKGLKKIFARIASEEGFEIANVKINGHEVECEITVSTSQNLSKIMNGLKGISSREIKHSGGGVNAPPRKVQVDPKSGRPFEKFWANGFKSKLVSSQKNFETLEKIAGSKLAGEKYKPLFPYFESAENGFEILAEEFVSDADGTGIVHCAPYGEDDFAAASARKWDISEFETVDESGRFLAKVSDFAGAEVLDSSTNRAICEFLEKEKKVFKTQQISHNYPHCWRCETPLFYAPQRAYFLAVEEIRQKMLKNNQKINWEPEHLKNGRFAKGLETAPDWNLSRNRFWGCPVPIWKCENEDCQNQCTIGSGEELEKVSGQKVDDFHSHFLDEITWDCEKCSGKMCRTPEVLDCWFESGSMPFAQEGIEIGGDQMPTSVSGDFITEYIAQTRGWFYTLHVLGSAIFDAPAFENVICTGTILAEDGSKMSKSKNNYPDPSLIFEKYGSDPMRFYLMASSVMSGENFNFCEAGVAEVLKNVVFPIKSAYQFFATYANIDDFSPTKIIFVRHGEGEHNVLNIYSGRVENEHHLTENGRAQVAQTAEKLKGEKIEAMFCSPFIRTRETAGILREKLEFAGEVQIAPEIRENNFGKLEGQKYLPPDGDFWEMTVERPSNILSRCGEFVQKISDNFAGKTVLAVGHGDSARGVCGWIGAVPAEVADFRRIPMPETAGARVFWPRPKAKTELDRWILSRTESLILHFRQNMDDFRIAAAVAPIAKFVDDLNNWYLRRSRKRFWASGGSAEKTSGFETLHFVLRNLAKILAPVCPFFAEKLWRDLTGERLENSVHLEFLPFADETKIDLELEKKMATIREICALAAGVRANAKIKNRQPLAKLSFCAGEKINFSAADLAAISEEANVKKVEILDEKSVEKFAKKVVKIDARAVGKKFGPKVQSLISAGKNGEFEDLENGEIKVAGEILSPQEFEVAFLAKDGFDAAGNSRAVVILQTEISENLAKEGLAREIIRAIQSERKSQKFEISDRISLSFWSENADLVAAARDFGSEIAAEVLAEKFVVQALAGGERFEIEKSEIFLQMEKL